LSVEILTGHSSNGLPYLRYGNSKRILLVIDGLDFTHKPPSAFQARFMSGYIKALAGARFTIYMVRRKPNLPDGYSMKDMADDYAAMIKNELGGKADVMGISTGGPIAQELAIYHPETVKHLVLASTGCRLNARGKALQKKVEELVKNRRYRAAAALFADALATGIGRFFLKILLWTVGVTMYTSAVNINDGIVEIEAEDVYDSRERLKDIRHPTLVIGGDKDFFYDLKELADSITGSKLILYNGVGHGAMMHKNFSRDLLEFLS
jgi:pimeloyl-ACP methyl ester carboxylesterase